jgi:lipoyl(octanoyl) transferase
MQQFTSERSDATADEIWITEHPPVYTLGLNGKLEHLLNPTQIPVVSSDRGGQITYHGPGQLVVYPLIDLKRIKFGPRQMVSLLEIAVIETLSLYGLKAQTQTGAPGVYIEGKKIASLGLRIKRNCCYHGVSINNRMDLSPFQNINPCGYAGLEITQLADYGVHIQNHELAVPLVHRLIKAIES